MKVDFIRFKASDEVELQGWLTDGGSDAAAIHIHGLSANGYERCFLDNLRKMYARHDISFFTIDVRGRGNINHLRQGDGSKLAGSCFEIFQESAHDIQGAIDYLSTRGKTTFILEGHSLGSAKVVNFVLTRRIPGITKIILLAPSDMTGWAQADPRHQEYLSRAKQLLSEGKGEALVGAECWPDKIPMSAQTYPTTCEAGSSVDIYGDRQDGPLLGRVALPMLIVYGNKDAVMTTIDGSMEGWLQRVNKFKHPKTKISVIKGADHGFRGYEQALADVVHDFLA